MPVRRKITALAVGALAVTGGIPAGASAAEPGFTVDPQSPAGVEYQVPLDNARNQGGGSGHHGGGGFGSATGGGGNSSGGATGGGGSSAGTGSPNLFGTGISPATTGSGASGAGGSNGATGGGARGAGGHGSGAPSGGSGTRRLPSLTTTADYSSTGPIAGIVAAILVTGAAFGLFLRLRARGPKKIFS